MSYNCLPVKLIILGRAPSSRLPHIPGSSLALGQPLAPPLAGGRI
jgi:hypothetical protein